MACRLLNPVTSVGCFPNFCANASDKLCAGSVETNSTDLRCLDNCTAKEQEVVVLPIQEKKRGRNRSVDEESTQLGLRCICAPVAELR
jgi:hypothetical protein